MNKITSIELFGALMASKGIKPGVAEDLLASIDIAILGIPQQGTRGLYYQLGQFRVGLGQGANPAALKGELYLLTGKSAKAVTPSNPEGDWKFVVVR